MWKLILICLPFWSFLPSAPTPELQVQLSFSNVRGSEGKLLIGVCRNEEEFPYSPFRFLEIPKTQLEAGVPFQAFIDLPPGTYAFAILDDENENKEMDTNFLGIPKEGFAFSNNVGIGLLGMPSFEQCQITIDENNLDQQIKLVYFLGN